MRESYTRRFKENYRELERTIHRLYWGNEKDPVMILRGLMAEAHREQTRMQKKEGTKSMRKFTRRPIIVMLIGFSLLGLPGFARADQPVPVQGPLKIDSKMGPAQAATAQAVENNTLQGMTAVAYAMNAQLPIQEPRLPAQPGPSSPPPVAPTVNPPPAQPESQPPEFSFADLILAHEIAALGDYLGDVNTDIGQGVV